MASDEDRILGSLTDVLAVEHHAPGMVRVVTVGDSYVVDVRQAVCECPDYEYNLDGHGKCKHIHAAERETEQSPVPAMLGLEESLAEPTGLPDFENYDRRKNYA